MDNKKLGDLAFIKRNYLEAIRLYSQGIEEFKEELGENCVNLLLNRCASYMKLECWSKGAKDAEAVMTLEPQNDKALIRHIKCLWGLGDYGQALKLITEKLELFPDLQSNKELLQLQSKAESYLKQSTCGVYDIEALLQHQQSTPKEQLELGTFAGGVEVKESKGKGRGLFATQDFVPGQLILCSRPFVFHSYDSLDTDGKANYILVDKIMQKLSADPELASEFYTLMCLPVDDIKPLLSPSELVEMIESRNFDEVRAHGIIAANQFAQEGFSSSSLGSLSLKPHFWAGLWILPSYINHSCSEANSVWSVIGENFFVRAVKPIKKGDQVFHAYVNVTWDYDQRVDIFKDHKFVCQCRLCQLDRAEGDGVRGKRKKILEQMAEFRNMKKLPPKPVLDTFQQLISLRKDAEGLNFPLVESLPRSLLQKLYTQTEDGDEGGYKAIFGILQKMHGLAKFSAHAQFVPELTSDIIDTLLQLEGTYKRPKTLLTWVKQLKKDLNVVYGSPKALKFVRPDMLQILQENLNLAGDLT